MYPTINHRRPITFIITTTRYPWGDEAFERAKELDRPILLSSGYSTCHWCHVLQHESFESERIAKLLNERFVPIKVLSILRWCIPVLSSWCIG